MEHHAGGGETQTQIHLFDQIITFTYFEYKVRRFLGLKGELDYCAVWERNLNSVNSRSQRH